MSVSLVSFPFHGFAYSLVDFVLECPRYECRRQCLALFNKIEECGCAIVCLQKTKRSHFDHSFIRKCFPRRFNKFENVLSDGASSGLIIIWCSTMFSRCVIHRERFALTVTFTSSQSGQTWNLTNIYGPCSSDNTNIFVQWLENLAINPSDLWILMGEFNFIRSTENRNRPGGNVEDMTKFNEIISGQ